MTPIYCIEYVHQGLKRKKYVDLDKIISIDVNDEDPIMVEIAIVTQLLENPIFIRNSPGLHRANDLRQVLDALLTAWKEWVEMNWKLKRASRSARSDSREDPPQGPSITVAEIVS